MTDNDCSIAIHVHMNFTWSEPRLEMLKDINSTLSDDDFVPLDLRFLECLWVPDIYIYRLKNIEKKSFYENLEFGGLYLYGDSRISYDMMFDLSIYCDDMRFSSYPKDKHNCTFMIGSYSHDRNAMEFDLTSLEIIKYKQLETLDYKTEIFPLPEEECIKNYTKSYSVTGYQIRFHRNLIKYIVTFYIPSALVVMVSWVKINTYLCVVLMCLFKSDHYDFTSILIQNFLLQSDFSFSLLFD